MNHVFNKISVLLVICDDEFLSEYLSMKITIECIECSVSLRFTIHSYGCFIHTLECKYNHVIKDTLVN